MEIYVKRQKRKKKKDPINEAERETNSCFSWSLDLSPQSTLHKKSFNIKVNDVVGRWDTSHTASYQDVYQGEATEWDFKQLTELLPTLHKYTIYTHMQKIFLCCDSQQICNTCICTEKKKKYITDEESMGHGWDACTPEGPWTGFKMDLCKCVITQAVQIYLRQKYCINLSKQFVLWELFGVF